MVERVKAKKPIFESVDDHIDDCNVEPLPGWKIPFKQQAKEKLAKCRGVWRDQVLYDKELQCTTRVLGYEIADNITKPGSLEDYCNTGRMIVWPSNTYLADRMGISSRTIVTGMKQLIDHGHLKLLLRGNQFDKRANRYELIIHTKA